MEIRQLEYFVAVVEEANFTRAAAKLDVTQPGVSAQIRLLERELGQALLDRSGRRVRLTHVGAAVLPHVRAALRAIADARNAVDELMGMVRGRVSLGMIASCSSVKIPRLLAEFHDRYPDVEITLLEANSDLLIEGLRSGELDLALVSLGHTPQSDIATQIVTSEAIVAAVSRGNPLAKMRAIPLEGLEKHPLISLPQGTGIRTCLDEACAAKGLQPRILFEAGNLNMLASLAARGLGVAFLPESFAQSCPQELHVITVTHPSLSGRIALAWRAQGPASPAAKTFISQARALFATMPGL